MINLSIMVLTWYQQRRAPRLFAATVAKQHRISIHTVINLNGKVKQGNGEIGNTLALLHLVRKRGALTPEYLANVSAAHKTTAARILRAWNNSKARKIK